jgi:pentatricopeptide repeat protein
VIAVNKAIKQFGDKRHIDKAVAAFESLSRKALDPTIVSYNVLLFALIKCGDLTRATAVYHEMLRDDRVEPNIVTFTTVLKGCCEAGDLEMATSIVDQIWAKHLQPTERTVSTFLRGCMWVGDVDRALTLFTACSARAPASIGATCVDYIVRLLSAAVRTDDAHAVLERCDALLASTPAPFVALALACALVGERERCVNLVRRCDALLSNDRTLRLFNDRASADGESSVQVCAVAKCANPECAIRKLKPLYVQIS